MRSDGARCVHGEHVNFTADEVTADCLRREVCELVSLAVLLVLLLLGKSVFY